MERMRVLFTLILVLVLTSCGISNEIKPQKYTISYTDTLNNNIVDTIIVFEKKISRQERLSKKDSMKHVENLAKLKVKELSDSLDFLRKDNRNLRRNENKGNRIVRGVKKDSSNFEIQKLKQENKELKLNNEKEIGLLNAEVKRLKQEGNNEKAFLKQQGKNEKKRVVWWMWLIIVGLILSLLLNILLLLIRR